MSYTTIYVTQENFNRMKVLWRTPRLNRIFLLHQYEILLDPGRLLRYTDLDKPKKFASSSNLQVLLHTLTAQIIKSVEPCQPSANNATYPESTSLITTMLEKEVRV